MFVYVPTGTTKNFWGGARNSDQITDAHFGAINSDLKELQDQTGVALIFVTHNLGIVAKMCNQIAVMYAGKIVEQGTTRDIFNQPQHPYTDALLKSIPILGNKDPLYVIPGQPPNLAEPPD